MTRDMELIREILIAIEKEFSDPRAVITLEIPGYDPEYVSYHVMLLNEAKLINARDRNIDQIFLWQPTSLTWEGHEFLDAARNDSTWNKAMTKIKGQAASAPFEVVKAVVIQTCKEMFGVG